MSRPRIICQDQELKIKLFVKTILVLSLEKNLEKTLLKEELTNQNINNIFVYTAKNIL